MAFEMIDRDQRLAGRQRQALAGEQRDHHAADQAGAGGRGDGVDVGDGLAGLVQHLPDEVGQDLDMGAGGDLRDHAAERPVRLILADDGLRQDLPVARHQRRRSCRRRRIRGRGSAPFAAPFAAQGCARLVAAAGLGLAGRPWTGLRFLARAARRWRWRRRTRSRRRSRSRTAGRPTSSQIHAGRDDRRQDPGPAAGRGWRQGAVDQGARSRAAGRTRSISASIR